jgi:pilus assembly protein CpaB
VARSITAAASNNSRNRGILMLAAVFGLLSAALMFAFLQTKGGDSADVANTITSQPTASETVVVLTRDVAVGEQITEDMLTTRAVPVSALLEGRVVDVDEVIGKVATAPLFAGEQMLTPKVTAFDGEDTLAYKVPEGLRALSLEVPHEAWNAAGLVQPGDRVDVLGVTVFSKIDPLTGEERPDLLAGLIAQDVLVLAVSQTIVKVVPNLDGDESTELTGTELSAEAFTETDTYQEALSVTLALTPEQSAKVAIIDAMRDDEGQYRILVRQPGDEDKVEGTVSWSFEDLFEAKAAAE